ncbi:hypothetical protein [Paenibacillus sp. 1P03SA]|uniref:hypothetical protein n=1 Tax=Paenibacillus sp. 1P03SA TaxID=3132294 RepID=UPI00399F99B9
MEDNFLFVITLDGLNGLESYAKIAPNYDEAANLAISTYREEQFPDHPEATPEPIIQHDLSWELTCASDAKGCLYDVSCQVAKSYWGV